VKHEQRLWKPATGWRPAVAAERSAQLVLVFGSRGCLSQANVLRELRAEYPAAILFGCTTAGEIAGDEVIDDSVVATAVTFESTTMQAACVRIADFAGSAEAGEALARAVTAQGLRHVLVLSDGLQVNGSDLVRGLTAALPPEVSISGGLSGDSSRFEQTLVVFGRPGEADAASSGWIAAVGFQGEALRTGCGSLGGWDPFGPERRITRSRGNVLYELDGQSALALYKRYLGEHAADLPSSGLLFPLAIRAEGDDAVLVRTILAVNEADQSVTFAGDVPEGQHARLMKANFDRLVDGATGAAQATMGAMANPDLAILISCVGRKLVLKQRVEDEIEGVRDVLGPQSRLTGFYSYGEISPFVTGTRCELHNQTMTITTLSEV
jgi:hypothetical protein